MKGHRTFIDQYGTIFTARTVKDLRAILGGRYSRMYRDRPLKPTVHVGYVIGHHWLTEYAVVERPIKENR